MLCTHDAFVAVSLARLITYWVILTCTSEFSIWPDLWPIFIAIIKLLERKNIKWFVLILRNYYANALIYIIFVYSKVNHVTSHWEPSLRSLKAAFGVVLILSLIIFLLQGYSKCAVDPVNKIYFSKLEIQSIFPNHSSNC